MLVIFFTRVAGCTRCSKVTAGDWNNFTKCRKKIFGQKFDSCRKLCYFSGQD